MTHRQDRIVPRFEPEVLHAMATRGRTTLDLSPYALTPLHKEEAAHDKVNKAIWLRSGVIAAAAFALAAIGYHNCADDNTPYGKAGTERSVLRTDIIDRTDDPAPSIRP
jgi:hypothetical protein